MATVRAIRHDSGRGPSLVPKPETRRIDWSIALFYLVIVLIGGAEIGFAVYGFIHACSQIAAKLVRLIP